MNKLRIHCLLHEDFEGIGCIADWISLHGHDVSFTEFYQDAALPPGNKVDFLIIMGGSMSVNDEATLPWLADEKVFVKALIDANKPVLGICLGAQLIANVLGASVYPNSSKEIGWLPVVLSDFAKSGPLFKAFRFPLMFFNGTARHSIYLLAALFWLALRLVLIRVLWLMIGCWAYNFILR